jgi:hypothetical protein
MAKKQTQKEILEQSGDKLLNSIAQHKNREIKQKEKTIPKSFSITPSLLEKYKNFAHDKRESFTNLILLSLEEYYNNHQEEEL